MDAAVDPDAMLMLAYARGDLTAFETLYARHRGMLYRFLLRSVRDTHRTAVLLRLEQELSLEEIAAVTDAGRETVKSRLRYAMNRLREVLSE